MFAQSHAQQGYGVSLTTVRSDRNIEYDLFGRITSRLARANDNRATDFTALASALSDNRRFWMRLAQDVSQPENGLPEGLRAQIFYLAEYVGHHSTLVLRGEANADALIDVNRMMMRGLSGEKEEKVQ